MVKQTDQIRVILSTWVLDSRDFIYLSFIWEKSLLAKGCDWNRSRIASYVSNLGSINQIDLKNMPFFTNIRINLISVTIRDMQIQKKHF